MPLSLSDALNAYGFVGQLANAIPDLKGILDQAIAGEWVPEQFKRTLMDSGWWKTNAESVRQLARLQATDPATYEQNLNNAADKVMLAAGQMGRAVDNRGLALQALLNNWDDQQLRAQIARHGTTPTREGGALGGEAGQMQAHMREVATNYGVPFSQASLDAWTLHIQAGLDTTDGWEQLMRARSKAQFPHLADQIDAGMTVRDIADPYIATMAQTLEVSETGINLTDPAIQRALQVKDPTSGAFSNKPMYQFQRELKDDPRWDNTKNAEQEAYRMVSRLGRDMGFLAGGS